MAADLVPDEAIPQLAAQIDSPATLRVLRRLRQAGFLHNGRDADPETVAILQRLADLGLVDPAYEGPKNGKPFVWVRNRNGERVLRYFETLDLLKIQPLARTALASLSEEEQGEVLASVQAL
jgi:hypothetical protein